MRVFTFLTLFLGLIGTFAASAQTQDQKAQALINAYPDHLIGFDGVDLIWKDGTRMPFGEGRADKLPEELLDRPDIADMFHWPYIFDGAASPASDESDPGRVRSDAFFAKMYGGCQKRPPGSCASVKCVSSAPLKSVAWVPRFSGGAMQAASANGVDEKLRLISKELEALGPSFAKYLVPSGGSTVPRCIAGTTRLSVHSFGIAVDINPQYGGYWQYGLPRGMSEEQVRQKRIPLVYKNRIPIEIVRIFEKYGFIWGGNWYHFDGMHFEYRPEFLALKAIMSW